MRKKLTIIAILCAFSVIFTLQNVHADTFYICTVDGFGPAVNASGKKFTYILLSDTKGTFSYRYFTADPNQANQFMATAMFAISNNMNVKIALTSDAAYSYITSMYIFK